MNLKHLARYKTLIGSFVFISLYTGALLTFAAPLTFPYKPSDQITDPTCLPVTSNCYVNPLAIGALVADGGNNQVLYVNSTGKLASDQMFVRTPTLIDAPSQTVGTTLLTSINNTSNNSNGAQVGIESGLLVTDDFAHTNNNLIGSVSPGFLRGNGSVNYFVGAMGIVGMIDPGVTGTINHAEALVGHVINHSSGTITDGYVLYGEGIDATNKYGVYIDEPGSKNVLWELDLKNQSALKWFDGDSSNFVAFKAPANVSTDTTFTLPDGYGTNGQVLTTDGFGSLTWQSPGGGGASGFTTTKVSLSSSQILNLNTSPVELLPAPGVGKLLSIISISIRRNFVTTPYSGDIYPNIYIGSGNSNNNITGTSLDFTSTLVTTTSPNGGLTPENEPLLINVGGGNPVGGDGTLDIYITYKILDL